MKRRRFLAGTAGTAIAGIAAPAIAQGTTEITVQYAIPDLFKEVHEEIAKQFMAATPSIKVKFLAPAKEYEDATQQVLRAVVQAFVADLRNGCRVDALALRDHDGHQDDGG